MAVSQTLTASLEFPLTDYKSTYQLILEKKPSSIFQYLLQNSTKFSEATELAEIMHFNFLKKLFSMHSKSSLITLETLSWVLNRTSGPSELLNVSQEHQSLLAPIVVILKLKALPDETKEEPKSESDTNKIDDEDSEDKFLDMLNQLGSRASNTEYKNIVEYFSTDYQELKSIINNGEKIPDLESSFSQSLDKPGSFGDVGLRERRSITQKHKDEIYELLSSFGLENPFSNKTKIKEKLLELEAESVARNRGEQMDQTPRTRTDKRRKIQPFLNKPSAFITGSGASTKTTSKPVNTSSQPLPQRCSYVFR